MNNIDNARILSGSSHRNLAKNISNIANIPIIDSICDKFANGEIRVKINNNIRNKDILLIQTGSNPDPKFSINDYLMETLILIDACKRSAVNSITLIN